MTWWIRIVLGLNIDLKDRFAGVDAFIRHAKAEDLHRIEAGRIQIRKERHSTARLRIPCVEFHGIALRWQATPPPPPLSTFAGTRETPHHGYCTFPLRASPPKARAAVAAVAYPYPVGWPTAF